MNDIQKYSLLSKLSLKGNIITKKINAQDIFFPIAKLQNSQKLLLLNNLAPLTIDITTKNNNLWSTLKYLPNAKNWYTTPITNSQLIFVCQWLKKLHKVKIKNSNNYSIFPYLSLLKTFFNKLPLAKKIKFKHLYARIDKKWQRTSKLCMCHNDVNPGNVLIDNGLAYVIDYDFIGLNNPLFDVASLISECNLTQPQIKIVKKCFHDYDVRHLEFMIVCANLLWLSWAHFMYQKTKNKRYWEIANAKEKLLA